MTVDPRAAALALCSQLARNISAKCPSAQADCDQLMFWIDTVQKSEQLSRTTYLSPKDFSGFDTVNDAVLAFMEGRGADEVTAGEALEALVAGNYPKSKLAGFEANFFRAIGTKNREELEIEKTGGKENRDNWIIRLRPTANPKPPRSLR